MINIFGKCISRLKKIVFTIQAISYLVAEKEKNSEYYEQGKPKTKKKPTTNNNDKYFKFHRIKYQIVAIQSPMKHKSPENCRHTFHIVSNSIISFGYFFPL